jgi:hypothetical protein
LNLLVQVLESSLVNNRMCIFYLDDTLFSICFSLIVEKYKEISRASLIFIFCHNFLALILAVLF